MGPNSKINHKMLWLNRALEQQIQASIPQVGHRKIINWAMTTDQIEQSRNINVLKNLDIYALL